MYSLHKPSKRLKKSDIISLLKKTLLVFIVLCLLGAIIQHFYVKSLLSKINTPGKSIFTFKHDMQVYDEGKGKVSIVLIPDYDTFSSYNEFSNLRPLLSPNAKVFTYDRCGNGFSEKSPKDFTNENAAAELKYLLKKKEIKPPYVLVAHSYGALDALAFAQFNTKDVAGIIFINGQSPESVISNFKPSKKSYFYSFLRNLGILSLDTNLGLNDYINYRKKYLPKELAAMDKALYLDNFSSKASLDRANSLKDFAKAVKLEGKLKEVPIYVLHSSVKDSNKKIDSVILEKSQTELEAWSSNSKRINLPSLGYNVHLENPKEIELISKEILEITMKKGK